jgi:hypothetical protein
VPIHSVKFIASGGPEGAVFIDVKTTQHAGKSGVDAGFAVETELVKVWPDPSVEMLLRICGGKPKSRNTKQGEDQQASFPPRRGHRVRLFHGFSHWILDWASG